MGDKVPNAAEDPKSRPARDCLLVVGPGRSGSTFLYRLVNQHPAFCAPQIKEGRYYRSPWRFERARRKVFRKKASILLDVANLAWRDPALPGGVKALAKRGHRVLLVVLLRDHRGRAASVMAFRRSRGLPSALLGRRALEHAAVRDSLTPEHLSRIFALGADVLVIGFRALVDNTQGVLGHLARLCGTPDFAPCSIASPNPAVQARNVPLSAVGKLMATALRKAGFLRLLQRLKDNPRVMRLFFRPAGPGDRPRFSNKTENQLASLSAACRHAVEKAGERLDDDLWLVRAESGIDRDA